MRPPRGESQKKEENLTSGFGFKESVSLVPNPHAHAVADLNQSETRNVAIFRADFCLSHMQRLGTHRLSAVLSLSLIHI